MHSVVVVLLVVSLLLFSLQLSLFSKKEVAFLWLMLIAIGIYLLYPKAIEQSYSRFLKIISNVFLMSNFLVITAFESIAGVIMSIYMIQFLFDRKIKYKVLHYVNYLPSIVAFPAIFYLESYAFLHIRHFTFQILAIVLAVTIPLFLWLLQYLFTFLIPEIDLRFELKFFIHFLQLILSIVLSVLLFSPIVPVYAVEKTGLQLLTFLAIALCCFFTGYGWYRFRLTYRLKRKNHGISY